MVKRGKNYKEREALVDQSKTYSPEEAVKLAKALAFAKFDETVELHMRTGLDPRHAEQQLRGTALLPHGLGKKVRVLVFAEGDAARGSSVGTARRQHHGVLQGLQREDFVAGRLDCSCRDPGLRGPLLHVYAEDASRFRPAQEGRRR